MLEPLFPGYMFLNDSHDARHAARCTHYVCQVLDVLDQCELIRELSSLEAALVRAEPGSIDRFPKLPIGAWCRVRRGKLQGTVGRITEHDGLIRLILEITLLGTAAALTVDAADLEFVDDLPLNF